jgi:hypothetical protein
MASINATIDESSIMPGALATGSAAQDPVLRTGYTEETV